MRAAAAASMQVTPHPPTPPSTPPALAAVPSLESFYLVVINILLLVQDLKLRPLLSKLSTRGEDLSWYREKALGEVRVRAREESGRRET